jgi:hypothetical protein
LRKIEVRLLVGIKNIVVYDDMMIMATRNSAVPTAGVHTKICGSRAFLPGNHYVVSSVTITNIFSLPYWNISKKNINISKLTEPSLKNSRIPRLLKLVIRQEKHLDILVISFLFSFCGPWCVLGHEVMFLGAWLEFG